ncbi:hypothetical protein [Flagellimonas meishanensis]|uniref:hypothetical protein n=1 Tax=Flagellimonas meishanensis TaxID=2873264 RepID=UPI001CA68009|nr:hypothetical protein [[Muricauda] meishanensis]
MDIFITLDYELFFGSLSGTLDNCIIKPTEALIKVADRHGIKFTCFVDVGYLAQLEGQKGKHAQLERDYEKICTQIRFLADKGHGIELHVHPHWEDSYFNGAKWIFDTKRYKLKDFADNEVMEIVTRYTQILQRISGKPPVAYRAGGWSAQPFEPIKKALEANKVFIDSTVYPQGFYDSQNQAFDFRKVRPFQDAYIFSDDLTEPDENGHFLELPISSIRVSPFFFWKFSLQKLGRAKQDKPFGDGLALSSSKKEILRLLTTWSYSVVSVDGYKASLIESAFKKYAKSSKDNRNFVLIGHPKAFSAYSLNKLERFIEKTVEQNRYSTYSDLDFLILHGK